MEESEEFKELMKSLDKLTYSDLKNIIDYLSEDGLYDRKLGGGWEFQYKTLDQAVDKHMDKVQAMEQYLKEKEGL